MTNEERLTKLIQEVGRQFDDVRDELRRAREEAQDRLVAGITMQSIDAGVKDLREMYSNQLAWNEVHDNKDEGRIQKVLDAVSGIAQRVAALEASERHTASDVDKLEDEVDAVRENSSVDKSFQVVMMKELEAIESRRREDAERVKLIHAALEEARRRSSKPPRNGRASDSSTAAARSVVKLVGIIAGGVVANGSAFAAAWHYVQPALKAFFRIH